VTLVCSFYKTYPSYTVEPHYNGQLKKVSEVKNHLNFVIQYVEQSTNENVFAYYEHLRHLRQLLTEEISSKQTQQKINYFFKPINVSNQHKPGPSSSKD
jgi:ERCC4-type nuclease